MQVTCPKPHTQWERGLCVLRREALFRLVFMLQCGLSFFPQSQDTVRC